MNVRWPRWASPFIAALALASSGVGIVNRFTYDDRYIIELNPVMRSLDGWWRAFQTSYWPKDWGGDGYRPLAILAFKLESVIGGRSPMLFHAVNIALYVAVCVLVFALAKRFLPVWAAWIAAALFAVHPVHVEAVANGVGQAELIVAAALLSATILYVRDRQSGPLQLRTAAIIAVLYTIACFSKEHGIVLPAILVAAELTIIGDVTPWRARVRGVRPFFLLLTAIALAFIWVRSLVLADHGIGGFQPFTPFNTLHINNRDRVLTAIGVVPQWVRLLFWPAHLSSEYGPPEIEIAQGYSLTQLPGVFVLLSILGIGVAVRRRQPVISFGVAVTCITLLPSSNFLLPAGIVLAERTLLLPSLGAMLIVGAAAAYIAETSRSQFANHRRAAIVGVALCSAAIIAGLTRSVVRTRVWRDNDTLFRQAVVDSPRGYRAHYMLGAWNFENKRKRDGEAEYRKALNLFPYDPFLSYSMAEQYRITGLCSAALPLYKWTFGLDAAFPLGHTAYAWCLLHEGQYDEARSNALDAMRYGGDLRLLRQIVAVADSARAAKKSRNASAEAAPSKLPDSLQKTAPKVGRRLSSRQGKSL
jgi:hypothetical protein